MRSINPASKAVIAAVIILGVSVYSYAEGSRPLSGLNIEEFQKKVLKNSENWQANPFVQSVDSGDVGTLKLYGIAYKNKAKAAALINRQIVVSGDSIGSNIVVDIGEKYVVLRSDNGLFRLTFEGAANE